MRRFALAVAVVAVACGEPVVPDPDAGPALDAGVDGGPARLCARDAECLDGLFCTGEERCRPGEASADARGCITIPAPCAAEACDEAADECSACADADMDDDGHDATACGGDDCDDTRGDVHAGTPEVCDAAGVNEDCDDGTLGTDADGDEAYDPACCFQPADGALECGTDCDDTDDAIGPGAPERCNGVDDDCDAMIDEDFDCVQSQVVSGTNACGRDGMRRCSETCTWLDASFARAESASTCDYCDDSGAGLGEEIPFATVMNRRTEVEDGWTAYGDAGPLFTVPPSWVIVDGPEHRGGVYVPTTIRLGYGTTYVQARVSTYARRTPEPCGSFCAFPDVLDGSWALAVLVGTPSEFIGTGTGALPASAGIAVAWSFAHSTDCGGPLCPASAGDAVHLHELRGGSSSREIGDESDIDGDQDGPMGTRVPQVIWIEITPDDPRTSPDETRVGIVAPIGTGIYCANDSSMPCGVRFRPGEAIHIGITASATAARDVGVYATGVTVTQNGICGP